MTTARALILLCLLAVALWSAAPTGAAPGVGELRSRAEKQRERERSLAGGAARIGAVIARVERQLAVIERRRAAVQAELTAEEARLDRVQDALRAERARLTRLRARLGVARAALRDRLVTLYKTPDPDLASVALNANGFDELLERTEFLRRVRDQDQRIVQTVREARADATGAVARYARDEARVRVAVAGVRARRDALASMSQAAASRRATLAQARAARLDALRATRAGRQAVERRIRRIEAEQARAARAATGARGPGGPWAIPWAIVQCESGGQNLPPNGAGASGYYQIVPGTWRLHGGSGPAAWKASKAEQDRVAARIWNGGAGRDQWVCAALVD